MIVKKFEGELSMGTWLERGSNRNDQCVLMVFRFDAKVDMKSRKFDGDLNMTSNFR